MKLSVKKTIKANSRAIIREACCDYEPMPELSCEDDYGRISLKFVQLFSAVENAAAPVSNKNIKTEQVSKCPYSNEYICPVLEREAKRKWSILDPRKEIKPQIEIKMTGAVEFKKFSRKLLKDLRKALGLHWWHQYYPFGHGWLARFFDWMWPCPHPPPPVNFSPTPKCKKPKYESALIRPQKGVFIKDEFCVPVKFYGDTANPLIERFPDMLKQPAGEVAPTESREVKNKNIERAGG